MKTCAENNYFFLDSPVENQENRRKKGRSKYRRKHKPHYLKKSRKAFSIAFG